MKKLLIALFVLINMQVIAQQKGILTFKETSHDFAKIRDDGGMAMHKFEFTNTGKEPIIISKVETSCGCTTPDWSRQPVPPGGKGFITASFDPRNRSGEIFNKTITVHSNAQNTPFELKITGEVMIKEKTVENEYPFQMGNLRLKSTTIAYTTIYNDETLKNEIEMINNSTKNVNVKADLANLPKHLTVQIIPENLKPKEKGRMLVFFNAKAKNDFDLVFDNFYLLVDGVKSDNNKINVTATIKERFTDVQKQNPPAFQFKDNALYNFGSVKQGNTVTYTYKYINSGKTDLIIRKIKSSDPQLTFEIIDKIVKPGKEGSFKVSFNTKGKEGPQTKLITVITNIPDEKQNKVFPKLEGAVTK